MKMKNYFLGLLGLVAIGMATSCSNDDVKMNEGADDNGVGYLSINLVSTTEGTRAPGDQTSGQPGSATYEEGLAAENAVNKVRFYFFKATNTSTGDAPAMSCVAGGKSYYDWVPSAAGADMPNVEKSLVATIVLQKVGDTGDNISKTSYPEQVVAVLNPDYANLPEGNPTLSALRKTVNNYVSSTENANGFVMCNSCYGGGTSGTTRIATTAITAANVCTDPSSALANPVVIHVERCVAKVRVGYGTSMGIGTLVAAKDNEGNNVTVTEYNTDGTPKAEKKQVYIKLTGWNLTATTNKGWLSKHIFPTTWTDATFGGMVWNYAPYFRSFWAENALNAGQDYFNFNAIGGGKAQMYTNENAAENTDDDNDSAKEREFPTQVIVGAQLVDEDGHALEVCEYAGDKFIGESNLLLQMTNFASIYKKTTDAEGKTVYTKISPADVKLVTALTNGSAETGQENHGRYFVELTLNDEHMADDATTVWTASNIEGATEITTADVNTALKAVGHAKCWKTGMTYYYFPIRHLAPLPTGDATHAGVYGVVRNHIYDCTLNSVVGLGTPVYDPNETIWPEKPQPDNDTYIAAQINILSWRVVNNSVDLSSYK